MVERTITGLMLIVALIHIGPITGFFGTDRLASLYGIEIADPNLEVLMRHRAMLFGILGSFFAVAAFRPAFQPIAFVAAFASLASFFFLFLSSGDVSDSIRWVAQVDVVASLCLAGSVTLYVFKPSNGGASSE